MIKIAIRAYLVYLAFCLLALMPALNILTPWYGQKTFQRDLTTEIIFFNPFTLSLVARKATLPERNGEPFFGFNHGEINLSLQSLWSRGLVFDAVHFEDFYIDIVLEEDGTFNFSDLLPPADNDTNKTADDESSGVPGVTIRDLHFHSKQIRFTDRSRVKPFSTHYDGLDIAVKDLSTILEDGKPYSLEAKDEAGGILRWEGQLSVPRSHSEGRLSLSNISLAPMSRFIEPWVNFEITQGNLHVAGNYQINWAHTLSYRIDEANIAVEETAMTPQDGVTLADTAVSLQRLTVNGISMDGPTATVEVGSLGLEGLNIRGWSEGTKVSLAEMFAPHKGDEPKKQNTISEQNNAPSWSVVIHKSNLSGSEIHWQSELTEPSLVDIEPINLSISALKWPLSGETNAELTLEINRSARLNMGANVALDSGKGVVEYNLAELPLALLNPNLPSQVQASIQSGFINLNGQLSLDSFTPSSVTSDGAVTNFSVVIENVEKALTSWDTLRWKQLNVDLKQQAILLEELLIDNYSGRLHIFADGTVNAQRALMGDPQADETPAADENNVPGKPWSFSIPAISVTDSALDFMDESLPIPFRTVIGDLEGGISGLGSAGSDEAVVNLTGSVDGYAPVELTGTATLFAKAPALDLSLSFDGVDLARLTPYSGTYAGHAIDRGVLNLDLKYRLNDTKLAGDNQLVIQQLKLGEKIASDKAVDLPLNLAIALLTDASGVIDLAVPVSGDMDDPKFGLGSVIFSALVNIITKAVTAPFSLLANLVGTQEDLQRVTFPAGSAVLDEAGRDKLTALNRALMQRPELVLLVTGTLHPTADRKQLQKRKLETIALEQGITAEEWNSKGAQWERLIAKKYKTLNIESTEKPVSISDQFKAVADMMSIEPVQLQTLAQERAVAVKRFLVNELQLPAERSVIEKFDSTDKTNTFSGTALQIDS